MHNLATACAISLRANHFDPVGRIFQILKKNSLDCTSAQRQLAKQSQKNSFQIRLSLNQSLTSTVQRRGWAKVIVSPTYSSYLQS